MPEGDYIAVPDATMNYFSVDPSGTLGWERSWIDYFETNAHVVEVLSGKATDAY
ncbi:MAG: hypothetical protein ACRDG7_10425 [Candidatus Limnocylindria bacterium]